MKEETYSCDGSCFRSDLKEVRILPTSGNSNAILCRACFEKEIRWRKERNPNVWKPFPLPTWEELKVYSYGEVYERQNIE